MKMRIELMTVTPEMAHKWLANNIQDNRRVSPLDVAAIARDILTGRWRLNGDVIRLAHDDKLLDGQHRLLAVIKANKSVQTYVAFNCPEDIIGSVDSGRSRSLSDKLKIRGENYTHILAALIRKVWAFERGELVPVASQGTGLRNRVTTSEALQVLESHPELRTFAKSANRFPAFRPISAFGEYLYAAKFPRKAATFFQAYATGEQLPGGHPALVLRNKLLLRDSGHAMTESLALGYLFRAMQADIRGESITRFLPTRVWTLEKF